MGAAFLLQHPVDSIRNMDGNVFDFSLLKWKQVLLAIMIRAFRGVQAITGGNKSGDGGCAFCGARGSDSLPAGSDVNHKDPAVPPPLSVLADPDTGRKGQHHCPTVKGGDTNASR
nr:hypothetical protein [Luteolibacter pohnpeiensis]